MTNTRMFIVLLIVLFIILAISIAFAIVIKSPRRPLEDFSTADIEVVLFYDDVASLDAQDPLFRYQARTQLMRNFSIHGATTRVCTSNICTDTYKIPETVKYTQEILGDNTFFLSPKPEPLVEYMQAQTFATVPFRITTRARVPARTKITLGDLRNIIATSTIHVWFDETDPATRDAFQIFDSKNIFKPWSMNKTEPDLALLPPDDAFEIRPRPQARLQGF